MSCTIACPLSMKPSGCTHSLFDCVWCVSGCLLHKTAQTSCSSTHITTIYMPSWPGCLSSSKAFLFFFLWGATLSFLFIYLEEKLLHLIGVDGVLNCCSDAQGHLRHMGIYERLSCFCVPSQTREKASRWTWWQNPHYPWSLYLCGRQSVEPAHRPDISFGPAWFAPSYRTKGSG